jgi:hypothetical protein
MHFYSSERAKKKCFFFFSSSFISFDYNKFRLFLELDIKVPNETVLSDPTALLQRDEPADSQVSNEIIINPEFIIGPTTLIIIIKLNWPRQRRTLLYFNLSK